MHKVMKYASWLYAAILAVLVLVAVVSLIGGFSHDFLDPGM
jgi:hypothetical protein